MPNNLFAMSWPQERIDEAFEALARKCGFARQGASLPPSPRGDIDQESIGLWVTDAASRMGLEAEAISSSYAEVPKVFETQSPTLMSVQLRNERRFLVLLGYRRGRVSLLDDRQRVRRVHPSLICSALRQPLEAALTDELDHLLKQIGIGPRRRKRTQEAILRERLAGHMIAGIWLMRRHPKASFLRHVRDANLISSAFAIIVTHAVQFALWLLAWWLVGRGALQGRFEESWLIAWVLLLLTLIPLRVLGTWLQGSLTIKLSALLKQRLIYGALHLDPEVVRRMGTGQLLARVIDSESVESLALSGSLTGLLAGIELVMAAIFLVIGIGGWWHVFLLLLWLGFTAFCGWRFLKRRFEWTQARIRITDDVVERMLGHRTRLAQERIGSWHKTEDLALELYCENSAVMDRTATTFALLPRGWLLLGVIGLAPAFFQGGGDVAGFAIGLGAVLLATAALKKLVVGMSQLIDAAIALKQVLPLLQSTAATESAYDWSPELVTASVHKKDALIEAHDLIFRYRERAEPAIKSCNLRIFQGDKILLQGPSGGGKSTLAALLSALRQPESGLLLLKGLDRNTLGFENWRKFVVNVPQFHENHVLAETFAFNLLVGKRWPPSRIDLEMCADVCRELGLSELLERMPAGLMQMVGDTGWQLSHGERSRLFIARALLQHPDLLVLDESFAALDPQNLSLALTCVLKRASTIVVISHN